MFLYNKTNRCTNFPNLFWLKNELLHVSSSFEQFEDSFRAGPAGPARKLSSNRMTYTSAKCTDNGLLMMGKGTARNK